MSIPPENDVREYAYDDRLILNAAAGGGWTVLSMRDDFARVWPNPGDNAVTACTH